MIIDIDLIRENKNTKSNHWLNTIVINNKNIDKKLITIVSKSSI